MPKILIINAGAKQLPLLRLAKESGITTIVADSRQDMLCFPEADQIIPVAPFEKNALAAAAIEAGIDAVAYTTSEYPIPVVWEIVNCLGLPSILTDRAVSSSIDKLAMRRLLEENGLNDVPFAEIRDPNAIPAFGDAHGWPVILKPTNAGNQIGLILLDDAADFTRKKDQIEKSLEHYPVVAEQLFAGRELNAAALFVNGRMERITVSDRLHYGREHAFVVHEHRFPSQEPAATLQAVCDKTAAIGELLGLRHSILFVQYLATDAGVRTVELGVRVPGGMIWQLFRYATGIDLMEAMLRISLGRLHSMDDLRQLDRHDAVCIRFLSGAPGPLPVGKLCGIQGLESARALQNIKYADFYNRFNGVRPPADIPPLRTGADRFFCLISVGKTYDQAKGTNLEAQSMLRFYVD